MLSGQPFSSGLISKPLGPVGTPPNFWFLVNDRLKLPGKRILQCLKQVPCHKIAKPGVA